MRNVAPFFASVFLAAVGLAAGCGGGAPSPAAPTSPTAPSASAPTASDAGVAADGVKSWATMGREERLNLMKKEVMPRMKAEFQAFDANDFKDFSCVTCHGERVKHGDFTMPNPDLPHLDAANDFAKHKAKTPKVLDFMFKQVEPDMAKILGLPGWDEATHSGFGCGNCHVFAK